MCISGIMLRDFTLKRQCSVFHERCGFSIGIIQTSILDLIFLYLYGSMMKSDWPYSIIDRGFVESSTEKTLRHRMFLKEVNSIFCTLIWHS